MDRCSENSAGVFGLTVDDLANDDKLASAIRKISARMPTYITLKEVKKRWGHGQEDVFPVAQFEKLWGDIAALSEVDCRFFVVPRMRGQQLKDQAQLDGWLRDGSAAHVESLCQWQGLAQPYNIHLPPPLPARPPPAPPSLPPPTRTFCLARQE